MRYDQRNKNELVRDGPRSIYHIPEADALGLANYSEAAKIKYEEDYRQMNKSLRRFVKGGIAARKSKRFPPGRHLPDG